MQSGTDEGVGCLLISLGIACMMIAPFVGMALYVRWSG
jgi:hypothetical protein